MTTEGIDVRSVGNTLTLHETALIEAFNLKAAIEYQLKNCKYNFSVNTLQNISHCKYSQHRFIQLNPGWHQEQEQEWRVLGINEQVH